MNTEWKDDDQLGKDIRSYVERNLQRTEVLDYMRRDYPQYPWSLSSLDRRMRHFGINYIDYRVPIDRVKEAVRNELEGPGKLLGYRAMNQKLRTYHNIQVPRDVVYAVMTDENQEQMEARRLEKKKKPKKRPFQSNGSWNLASLDGHDKLCGYQNWMFPLGIYGSLDTFSRKIVFLTVIFSNSDPNVIGRKYFDFLYTYRHMPRYLRVDRGNETGIMTAIHAYLIGQVGDFDDPIDSVIFGKSTSNKIERWWRDLHERLEGYFKEQLKALLDNHLYDPENVQDRKMLAYIFIPVIQRECNTFVNIWNEHRIREQKDLLLPVGIPDHMFDFPETYGAFKDGFPLTEENLRDTAEASGVLEGSIDFLEEDERNLFGTVIPFPETIKCSDAVKSYLTLKRRIP